MPVVSSPPPLVGRAAEREAITAALQSIRSRPGGIVAIAGEPGIGKSRLLAHLIESADGCEVLDARASEFEADLPYAMFADALGEAPPALDRHSAHRALREQLERRAAPRPLVLCLDDVHWADPASLDALAALVRRPPAAAVLLALTAREGQLPAALATALAGAMREARVTRLEPGPLSEADAAELVGDAAAAIYREAGGNPFYLEQLARTSESSPRRGDIVADGSIPPAIAAALAAELADLSAEAGAMLEAAAVAGDPFDADLAAAVAELSDPAALRALDELLAHALVRPGRAPRRFAFRHPVVRHAVYVAAPGGWRLGAHARAADALRRRGAGPVRLAHHVEHAARPGDASAVDLLDAAARELQSPAPATAARYHAAALRLLPEGADHRARRALIQRLLADAQAAAGDAAGARATLIGALETAGSGERLPLTVALANQEWWLGGHEQARRRLHVALGDLPAEPSPDRIRLRLALALTALSACDLRDAQGHASDARDDARAIGDPVFELAALAAGALAAVLEDGAAAAGRLDESSAALERLTPGQLATRLPALSMHGRARRGLGRFGAALADLERGAAIAEETGRERVLLVLTVESVPVLVELGRLGEASAAGEEGLELARLGGNSRMLLWAHCAYASARLAAGDVAAALQHAGEAAAIDARPDFHAAGQPGWCLGAALTAAGNPERAVPAMLQSFGGAELEAVLPVDRPAAAATLVEAQLACGDLAAAEEALARGEAARTGTAWAAAVVGVARAALLLARGRAPEAVIAATAARAAAADAPLLRARARLAEGRALGAAGERGAAVEALREAEAALDGFGALRARDEAARELRRLGHRVLRPAREATAGPLTAREREIAGLIAAGRTNREVAEQLVLSVRTIDAHLRNIYGKLGVRSRVELTREVEPDAAADPG